MTNPHAPRPRPLHWRQRLRTRIILSYMLLVVIGFGGVVAIAGSQISRGANEDFDRNLETQVRLVARSLESVVGDHLHGELPAATVRNAIDGIAMQLDMRLTLIDTRGRPWMDSTDQLPRGNQRDSPEIAAAYLDRVLHDIRSDANGQAMVYTAAPIFEDGRIVSFIRLTVPASAAADLVRNRWLALGSGALLLAIVALAASSLLANSLTQPLEKLRQSALKLAGGNFNERIPDTGNNEIGHVSDAFNYMAEQIQAKIEEQRAFASNASHELRTPLTTIRLRSEALVNSNLDTTTARQYILEIDEEMLRLSDLVNDLILLSRLDAGRATMGQEQVDITRLAKRLLQTHPATTPPRHIETKLEINGRLPTLQASLPHLRIVFNNLLENARKYTPDGGTIIWRIQQEGSMVRSDIIDNGQGIAAADLPHLFERFYRADKARSRTTPGVGLGLPLAQSIVHFYGGTIAIDSAGLGQGTAVTVWWPLINNTPAPNGSSEP